MSIVIPRSELLSATDEVRLARAIEAGVFAQQALATGARPCGASEAELVALVELGKVAHDEFYKANLGMVVLLAQRWAQRATLPFEELLQEGAVGLGEAIIRWDHQRGYRFSTFAFPRVEWSISTAALLRCGQLEASRFQARAVMAIRRTQEHLEARLGRSVGIGEVAAHMGRETSAVVMTMQSARPASLSDKVADLTRGEDGSGPDVRSQDVTSDWMQGLPRLERVVLCGRYGIGEPAATFAELGRRLGVSGSTVRRIERRALNRARRMLGSA